MPRSSRYGVGRGTHGGKGLYSGSTVATIPSSVTMTRQGLETAAGVFVSPTEFVHIDGAVTKPIGYDRGGYFIETGIVDGFGRTNVALGDTSDTLSVNFATITTGIAFLASVKLVPSVASAVSKCTWEWSANDTAGVSIYCSGCPASPAAFCLAGSSIQWIAIGK